MTIQLESHTRIYWRWLSLFQVTLLVHLLIYILTPEVGNSSQFRLLALVLVAQALLVFGITTRIRSVIQVRWLQSFRRLQWLYLPGALGLLFVFGVFMRHEWVYAHAGLVLSASLGLAYITFFADDMFDARSNWMIAIVLVLGVIAVILRINALAVYPPIIPTDESWLLGWPIAWVRGLYPDDLLFFHGGEDVFHYFIPMGLWMQFAGTGFIQARVYQLIMTLVLMTLTFPLAKRLYDQRTAWLVVLMLFASSVMVLATTIRHDIGLAIMLTLSFLVHMQAEERNRQSLHFIAGLIVGFGLFTHYHAIAFGPVMMIALYAPYYVRDLKTRGWRPQPEVLLYALGGLIGAGIVFAVQIYPQLDAVMGARQFRSAGGFEFFKSYFEYFVALAELSPFEFLMLLAGIAGLLARRKLVDIQIVLTILLGHLALAVLAAQITLDYYVIPIAPFYAIAIITLFTRSLSGFSQTKSAWMALFFIVVNAGFILSTPIKYALDGKAIDDAPQPQGVTWIRQNTPPGSRILGDIYYFLWLTDYEFYAATSDRYVSSDYREIYQSPRDLWDDMNPDYIVFDPNIPTHDMDRLLASGFLDDNPDYAIVARLQGLTDEIVIYGRANSE